MSVGLRAWVPGTALAVVAVLAGGWFLGAQPLVAAAAASSQTATAAETADAATQVRLAELSRAAAKVDTLRAQDAVLKKAVPSILKPNTFIRRVTEIAALEGVTVKSILPSPAGPYAPAPSLSGATGTTGTAGTIPIGRTAPTITGSALTVVPMAVAVSGTEDDILAFTQTVQNDERLFAISSIALAAGDAGSTDATLAGVIYVLKR